MRQNLFITAHLIFIFLSQSLAQEGLGLKPSPVFLTQVISNTKAIISNYETLLQKLPNSTPQYFEVKQKINNLLKINDNMDLQKEKISDIIAILESQKEKFLTSTKAEIDVELYAQSTVESLLKDLVDFKKKKQSDKSLREKKIKELILKCDIVIIASLDKHLQEDFKQLINFFINPLSNYVIEKQNEKFLIDQFQELNMSWNTFNMQMTKRHKNPSAITTNLEQIRHLWNAISRIYFIPVQRERAL